MTDKSFKSADHIFSYSLVPWKDIPGLVNYLQRVEDTLDDGSNFGRVDGMSVSAARSILGSLGRPNDEAVEAAMTRLSAKYPDWEDGALGPEDLVKAVHVAMLEAMMTTFVALTTEQVAWPPCEHDQQAGVYTIGKKAWSDTREDANLIASRVNAFITAGEPYIAEECPLRPAVEVVQRNANPELATWLVGSYGVAHGRRNADLIAAAFAWHAERN